MNSSSILEVSLDGVHEPQPQSCPLVMPKFNGYSTKIWNQYRAARSSDSHVLRWCKERTHANPDNIQFLGKPLFECTGLERMWIIAYLLDPRSEINRDIYNQRFDSGGETE